MVDHSGKNLNHLFETLADWNTYLERNCPDIYSAVYVMKI